MSITDNSNIRYHLSSYHLNVYRNALQELNIEWPELMALSVVGMCAETNTACTASSISQCTLIPRTTIGRILDRLCQLNYIRKIDSKPYPTYARTDDMMILDKFQQISMKTAIDFVMHAEKIKELLSTFPDRTGTVTT